MAIHTETLELKELEQQFANITRNISVPDIRLLMQPRLPDHMKGSTAMEKAHSIWCTLTYLTWKHGDILTKIHQRI